MLQSKCSGFCQPYLGENDFLASYLLQRHLYLLIMQSLP